MSSRELNKTRLAGAARPAGPGEIRVCSVGYLNSVAYGHLEQQSGIIFTQAEPAECARRLFEDEADLALIPIVEFAQHGGFRFLPFGIAADGVVDSVMVFSHIPLAELNTIYVDAASRTSVILLRVLLKRLQTQRLLRNKVRVLRRAPNEVLSHLQPDEGVLAIGDLALAARGKFAHEADLARLWKDHWQRPFVFAVWAYNPARVDESKLTALTQYLERGLCDAPIRARAWADAHAFDREVAAHYVQEVIQYRLGEAELSGASQFLAEAAECGFLPRPCLQLSELCDTPKSEACASVGSGGARSLDSVLADAASGLRLSLREGIRLAQEASLADLGLAADEVRKRFHPDNAVSYIIDRNINYTNVCNVYCRFCAFYSAPGKDGGYLLSREAIAEKIEETLAVGGRQILLQGGLNPELGIEYYEGLFRWIKERYPVNLHALSADEIWHVVKVSKLSIDETLGRLITSGLGSLPGGGAEILVDRVRRRIARLKTSAAEWLEAHRVAHRLGITSTCTMMFGVQESWEDRLLHLLKLRSLQDETDGFTAFITWSFQDENTHLKKGDTSSSEYLRVQAVSRLFLDNIANLQSSWVTQGPSVGQVALYFGANDFGSVMLEENVVSAAGTIFQMDQPLIERHIRESGFTPWQRDVHYQPVAVDQPDRAIN